MITLLALASILREENNPSICFSHRLSWLSPSLLASAGSMNMTVVEMADEKATGIYIRVCEPRHVLLHSLESLKHYRWHDHKASERRQELPCTSGLFQNDQLQAEPSLAETSVPVPIGRWPGRKLNWKILTATFLSISLFPTALKSLAEVGNFL